MRFLNKSVIRKLVFVLVILTLILGVLSLILYSTGKKLIPYYYLIIVLGAYITCFFLVYWIDVVRPLKKILNPVQALLAGKDYKRIFTNRIDEFGVLAHFFNKVTSSLGEVSMSMKDRERMIDELQIASQLQSDILPTKIPQTKGLQIVAKTRPASELGGDSFNVFNINDKFFLYIGDVTGHGVAAALIMTMVSSLLSVFAETCNSVYEIIINVNKYIKKHVKKSMFMTMVMFSWNQNTKKMTYVGAGHEHILVYRAVTGSCDAILTGGVALGMVPDISKVVKEVELELADGDFVVLYSDGITEARNTQGEQFGLDRLKNLVVEYAPRYSAEGVHYHIAKDVSEFMTDTQQSDDMTLIVIKRDESITGQEPNSEESTSF